MNKNKKLLIIITVLVILTIVLVYFSGRNGSVEERLQFTVSDTASVTKIFLADMEGRTVTLKRGEKGLWFVDDTLLVNRPVIDVFLKTLNMQMVETPSPKSSYKTVMSRLASSAVKVEVYQNAPKFKIFGIPFLVDERITKTFYVGDPTMDQYGTIMLTDGSDKPYIVYMPGLRGNVASRYSCRVDAWRDHSIFGLTLENLKTVTVEFPDEPQESFKFENIDNKQLIITDIQTGQRMPIIDTISLVRFANSFSRIKYESMLNLMTDRDKDSVRQLTPFAIVRVTPNSGRVLSCKCYYLPGDKVGYEYIRDDKWEYDRDHFMSFINDDKDLALCQFFTFDKILKRMSDFTTMKNYE